MTLRYLTIPYVPGGRTLDGLDCWGLVRMVRTEMFSKPELPSYESIDPKDKRALTRACEDTVCNHLTDSDNRKEGAIAAAWSGNVCVHVGVVVFLDNREWIMETDEGKGTCLTTIASFESRYSRVKYYD